MHHRDNQASHMSKREHMATQLMAAALAGGRDATADELAAKACERADALLKALRAKREGEEGT